ncbi:zona pellucida glycoprotein 2, like 2 [Salminus brasiliensis]|uniref:zona pellucida glycoprotein 2, like 2 n=1 Tax=Salminus brasiliensis TaxID=930266 RepID=UPI003B8371DC
MLRAVLTVFSLGLTLSSAQEPKDPWQMTRDNSLPNYLQQPRQDTIQYGGYPLLQSSPNVYQPPFQQLPDSAGDPQRCEVEDSSRVECGEPGISRADCEAIDCCYDTRQFFRAYDGPLCYYGKTVTVQCTKDGQFVVVVARDTTVPRISLDNLSLLEASGELCTAVDSNVDFAIYQFPVTSCGTRMKVDGDFVVYENMMASSYEVGFGRHGAITRDSSYELTFQCRYLATAVQPLVVDVNTIPPPPPVFQLGPLRVELRLANGICATKGCSDADVYGSYYTEADYPVTKALREPVYVEVRMLERADPNIALVLNHCWATSTPNPLSLTQWDLLFNGCPYEDDRYLTTVLPVDSSSGLQYPTHYKRFIVKMFAFVDETSLVPQQERIFIHCTTAVCQLSAMDTCEPSCGRTKRAVSATPDMEKILVSSGEVILLADLPVSAKSQVDSNEGLQSFSYGVVGVAALAVLCICGLLAALWKQRAKSHPCLQTTRL